MCLKGSHRTAIGLVLPCLVTSARDWHPYQVRWLPSAFWGHQLLFTEFCFFCPTLSAMEPWVAMYLLGPLLQLYRCLELMLHAGALLYMYQEAEIALDSLTREALATLSHQNPTVERPLWSLETSTDWWDRVVLGIWDNHQWIRNFRMRKQTFLQLCTWLTPTLQRTTTQLRAPIPVKKREASRIALWKLATPDSYHSVAQQFGVGRSTVGVIVIEVVHAVNDVPAPMNHPPARHG
ncbi:uncharacterized protein LOC142830941 [Pelodiscus sinensis]|uniref:uncharacterized protein LOC142830941 n=1 Tax=Pelodiscus sinensis TaxID=13735 RepID=UPI003F6CFAD9